MNKLPKLSPTSYAMLGLLARNPQSAYELNTLMQNSLIRVYWPRAESHVYSEPKKLLAHALVTERQEQVSGRNRTVYTITAHGRGSLRDWLGKGTNPDLRMQAEFMLKLILADGGSADNARATLKLSVHASQLDLVEAVAGIERILSNPSYAAEGMPYNGIVINLMTDMLIARYQWGKFAFETTSDITDSSSTQGKQEMGRTAYREALSKMRQALEGDS
ncbi:MAG: PadR family transcriptional regulator [Halioglobus sp.]